MLSSSQTNGHFLPALQPSTSFQTFTRSAPLRDRTTHEPVMKNPPVPSNGVHPSSNTNSANVTITEASHHRTQIHEDASDKQKPINGTVDKKKDRKTQARRYLVEGLCTAQYGSNGRRLCRSNTFSHAQQSASMNQAKVQRSPSHRNPKVSDGNNNNVKFVGGFGRFSKEDTSKVKKAIDNWNELVLELQSEQYKRLSSYDDRFSLDSDSSSDEDTPSPLYKLKHHKPLYASHSILPPSKSLDMSNHNYKNGNVTKSNHFSTTINFGRYRPITPNLLIQMDKNKLSSRKKTQRWINQLEVQSRSYHNKNNSSANDASRQDVLNEMNSSSSPPGEGTSPEGGVSGTPVDKTRTLHRTESYGSTKTRQSSNNKHLHGFL